MKNKFIWLILTHQPAAAVEEMITGWRRLVSGEIVILYGGSKSQFELIQHEQKKFIEDNRLVTRDHPRERQSYDGVFEQSIEVVEQSSADYVYFTEFDQIPMRSDIEEHLESSMVDGGLDLMVNGLTRVDGTNHPHWLNHDFDGILEEFLSGITVRSNKKVVLSSYGFGQCWKREGFLRVASVRQQISAYLELWIPSVAHHLGLKVGTVMSDLEWNTPTGVVDLLAVEALSSKPYFIHPLKGYWT